MQYFQSYLQEKGLTLADVNRAIIHGYIMSIRDQVSAETVNGRLRVFKVFWNFLISEDIWNSQSPMNGVRLLKTVKKAKPVISSDDLQRIIKNINRKTFEGMRNSVMLMLFCTAMLRSNELRTLKVADVDFQGKRVKVMGKGRKERIVPVGARTLKLIHQYLIRFRNSIPNEHLICMRSGDMMGERLIHKTVQRLGAANDIKLYPHLLRHSGATWYAKQIGSNLEVLRQILGHSSLLVTQNYLHFT